MKLVEINVLTLAFLGDAIYELYIREALLKKYAKVDDLQKAAVQYVSAVGQAAYLKKMIEEGILREEEIALVKRARNHKYKVHSKNYDPITYKHATALEALIAYIYLKGETKRVEELMNYIMEDLC